MQASKMLNSGFKSVPKWPTYQTAFLALENFLKAFLLVKGVTLEPSDDLRTLLNEAKAKGLGLNVAPAVEEVVMKASEHYPNGGSGEWAQVPIHARPGCVRHLQHRCAPQHGPWPTRFADFSKKGNP